jgi:hypothetical protein
MEHGRCRGGSLGGQIITASSGGKHYGNHIARFKDTGCELWKGKCIDCPFPRCLMEEDGPAAKGLLGALTQYVK